VFEDELPIGEYRGYGGAAMQYIALHTLALGMSSDGLARLQNAHHIRKTTITPINYYQLEHNNAKRFNYIEK
jgi:hypothetical protein